MSFRVEPGEIVGLLGPNGAGKTTSFHMVLGMVRPDEGAGVARFFQQAGLPSTELVPMLRARLTVGEVEQARRFGLAAAGLVALGAVTLAHQPADEKHHYGHDKAEYFSSGVEGATCASPTATGSGRRATAARSILPLGVVGKASTATISDGSR